MGENTPAAVSTYGNEEDSTGTIWINWTEGTTDVVQYHSVCRVIEHALSYDPYVLLVFAPDASSVVTNTQSLSPHPCHLSRPGAPKVDL